ncbi:Hypothetical protein AA314_06869 [Archangium gephyra]|uniref:Uncharacterized protein n=1 Tax=Archangium gephyra TaxID=48 RepID=A0AAC8QDI5_9BACT|nr:Hypothetical protein AA314_06869 [Archangium gephyra]
MDGAALDHDVVGLTHPGPLPASRAAECTRASQCERRAEHGAACQAIGCGGSGQTANRGMGGSHGRSIARGHPHRQWRRRESNPRRAVRNSQQNCALTSQPPGMLGSRYPAASPSVPSRSRSFRRLLRHTRNMAWSYLPPTVG